ncbi:hypothetical protein BLJAPNOD_06224 [Ensifer sp. M14]|uniref:polysaccharide deacetylase WbmS family protein n=1 Tax=Ensifer sp. M14 TaxID=2203782 RepID=UPI000E1CB19A|nr:hypothetical protein [Ensifer sp. M14]RDL47384.1 hypothetical protein BLJAPNOD_06224 [Ensifer sp. M14]
MEQEQPQRFVLTGDVDWASEYCIESYVDTANAHGIVPTLFVTHRSQALERFAEKGKVELGIHPNFLAGTTHGKTIDEIFDHVLALVPDAVALRCHAFFDNSHVAMAASRRGIRLDSNICCHLQENIPVLRHWNGVDRLPVFFEEDVHWLLGLDWDFAAHRKAFESSGLKILNFHPFMWTLNIPDSDYYLRHKQHITTLTKEQADALRHPGSGSASFLAQAIEWVQKSGGRFVSLSELHSTLKQGSSHETV